MREPDGKGVSALVVFVIVLLITFVIAAGTYIAHQGALQNYNMQGMTPGKQKPPAAQPFPIKPWK